ncbi:MAG: DNA alkylation repair protein [Candidatus Nealsonbacteria bacterium CG_4_8_14_3_um_filter_39_7]|uniref:DNA alkylation repair protein n=1 Tax=Candidatus Nealsonbacteria bacterium CG23_combo_of_CG06-09_8_20_14_all_39_17 TaxID=1974722 RepID=A0A2G9YU68_9BACT|nr:MAG: DNA alkylation repair protein [Candidatus Nealsonbacteria bacterium CG23_combo_of_CG06-09_8_20_14_all_39_17]PIU44002.1 MAG: DNA alkylation repair protein [Candidatus Nealsonbacteria bacterium CG07_land_8_20_14_0_80_39_13]PIW91621.1 MAG: DNA alkylation repair protein [Candidatus Nealsonbacteria bacterium CG_4_8_14_3_um_filter_39_7]
MEAKSVLLKLKKFSNPKNVAGMTRFGIQGKKMLGVSMPELRELGKEIGKDSKLSQELWETGIHEARILAGIIAEPKIFTEKQMDRWIKDFDSWDVCDRVCLNLFWQLPPACEKCVEWSSREREFEKRAGFALMAVLAVKDKKIKNEQFEIFFPIIIKASDDERNFVRKAVNWALRQIGKRNAVLNKKAIEVAKKILKKESKTAKWIANDAIRELTGNAIQTRLK